MKFDYVIIGGGLCGLSAGIRLMGKGKKTAIVSSGQSALHFCAGSFGLLGKKEGRFIKHPLENIDSLDTRHPYRLIGAPRTGALAEEIPAMLAKAGITVHGSASENHYTLTPFGTLRPAWLTFDGYPVIDRENELPFKKVVIVSIKGFLESYPAFVCDNLEKRGITCRIERIDLERLTHLRESSFDMRAVSVAKQMDTATIDEFATKINAIARQDETVLVPAVIGINSEKEFRRLQEFTERPVYCVPTIPVSVSGVRIQHALQRYFENIGGTYILGDRVDKGWIENGNVKEVRTVNFGEDLLQADAYILASGSLFSEGIIATPTGFNEPVFGLDINSPASRDEWCNPDFFGQQPYMSYGVEVDSDFHPLHTGKPIGNLYAAGAALAYCNSLDEDSGGGVAMLTGIHVADLALKNS